MQLIERKKDFEAYAWHLSQGVHPMVADALARRGVSEGSPSIPGLSRLVHWKELKNCEVAANILLEDIQLKTKMLIVADYDCDGATACAILYRGLKELGADINYMVPDRIIHGYGLTPSIAIEAKEKFNPDLIITVDNGIASIAGVDQCLDLGMRVLVTDHHLPGDDIPLAESIVNPNQKGCGFPSKNLAGCGVAWYLLWAMTEVGHLSYDVRKLLPIVALGTIADVVKLDENNRILVSAGLSMINEGLAQPGIYAIAKVAGKNPTMLTAINFGFDLGPRINAAGRLESMTQGINCLLTDDAEEADELAKGLDEINKERKTMQQSMVDEAEAMAFGVIQGFDKSYSICVADESWHEGVIGVVAGRIKEKTHRPTIVFSKLEDGRFKGSGRSITTLHLRDAIDLVTKRKPHLVEKFGGHAMAAGMTLHPECFKEFSSEFEKVCQELLTEDLIEEKVEHDGELPSSYICLETAKAVKHFVWGQGFPQPSYVGKFKVKRQSFMKEIHTRFNLETEDGTEVEGVLFNYNQKHSEGQDLNILYTLNHDTWQGKDKFSLMINRII